VRQILLLDGEALAGYDPASGNELWVHPWPCYMHINVAQPVVLDGDRVFISSGYDVGCAMLRITKSGDKWSAAELWRNKAMRCKFTSPAYHDGHLYGMDEGILACVDAADGKRKWKGDRFGNGQLLIAGGTLIIGDEAGKLVIARASPDKYQELGRVQEALPGRKNWNHLTVARGRAYVRNHFEMACFDLTAPLE
jgi:outer membrane protein assembly factor BamB